MTSFAYLSSLHQPVQAANNSLLECVDQTSGDGLEMVIDCLLPSGKTMLSTAYRVTDRENSGLTGDQGILFLVDGPREIHLTVLSGKTVLLPNNMGTVRYVYCEHMRWAAANNIRYSQQIGVKEKLGENPCDSTPTVTVTPTVTGTPTVTATPTPTATNATPMTTPNPVDVLVPHWQPTGPREQEFNFRLPAGVDLIAGGFEVNLHGTSFQGRNAIGVIVGPTQVRLTINDGFYQTVFAVEGRSAFCAAIRAGTSAGNPYERRVDLVGYGDPCQEHRLFLPITRRAQPEPTATHTPSPTPTLTPTPNPMVLGPGPVVQTGPGETRNFNFRIVDGTVMVVWGYTLDDYYDHQLTGKLVAGVKLGPQVGVSVTNGAYIIVPAADGPKTLCDVVRNGVASGTPYTRVVTPNGYLNC